MEACVRLPVIQRAEAAADSGIALADRSFPLLPKNPSGRLCGLSALAGAKKPRRGVDEGCGRGL